MGKIDGIENAEQWIEENPMPTVSEYGIDELLIWIDQLDQPYEAIYSDTNPTNPEIAAEKQKNSDRSELIMYVLKCVFAGPTGEEPNYFGIRLQALRERKAREVVDSEGTQTEPQHMVVDHLALPTKLV